MRPGSLLAVVAAAVLGLACGIGAGLALDRGSGTFADPLKLGFPYRNQSCSGKVLLTVARGAGAPQLGRASTNDRERPDGYLDTHRSCRTVWDDHPPPPPRYVAYLGPFKDRPTACDAEFRRGRAGGIVTVLRQDTTDTVHCLCFVDLPAPTLHPGVSSEGTNGVWIRQLQHLLIDMGRATQTDYTGSYDVTTVTKIRKFQADHRLGATGVVDAGTWSSLLFQGCRLYTA